MPTRPWYPMHAADFIADTHHLTAEQTGAYIRLINDYWLHGPLPADDEQYLRQITGLSKHKFRKNFAKIFNFFVRKDEKYFHRRIDKEIAKAVDIIEKRRKAAYAKHDANAPANAPAHADTTTTTSTEDQEQEQKQAASPPSEKDIFWKRAEAIFATAWDQSARQVCGMLVNACRGDYIDALLALESSSDKENPKAWISGIVHKRRAPSGFDPELRKLREEAEARFADASG